MKAGGIYGGAGGLLGARQAGFDIVYNCEPRGFVHVDTFLKNFYDTKYSTYFFREIREAREEYVDLLIGQPPCKRFSSLAVRKKNRELFSLEEFEPYYFFKEVLYRKPKFFILENLSAILKHIKVNRHGIVITDGYGNDTELQLFNYNLIIHRLNAKDFGVPQNRERVFIIGSRVAEFSYRPNTVKLNKNLWDVISKYSSDKSIKYNNNEISNHSKRRIEGFSKLKFGESYYGTQNNMRLNPEKVSPTITTHRTQYVHPFEPRTLTARECAALMGYPDDFIFYGGRTKQLDQVGASICPAIIKDICLQMKDS